MISADTALREGSASAGTLRFGGALVGGAAAALTLGGAALTDAGAFVAEAAPDLPAFWGAVALGEAFAGAFTGALDALALVAERDVDMAMEANIIADFGG